MAVLLAAVFAAGLAWMFALALVDGTQGLGHVLETPTSTAHRAPGQRSARLLQEYVSRIPYTSAPKPNWPVHVAGHPPGALLFFVGLDRLGLGGGLAAGLVVTVLAATTAMAVLVTLRVLGEEAMARRAAPFLVFGPAAVWQAVSADAMFAAVAAWGLAALALAATRRSAAWAVVGGLLLGWCAMLSYGLLLLADPGARRDRQGQLVARTTVRRRPPRSRCCSRSRRSGSRPRGATRPARALPRRGRRAAPGELLAVGRLRGAGHQRRAARRGGPRPAAEPRSRRVRAGGAALAAAGAASVLVAAATQMSKAEVERIWLPFVPWILLGCALLPEHWRRRGLVLQLAVALAVQHLLRIDW